MRFRLTPRETSFYDMFAASADNIVTGSKLLMELLGADSSARGEIAERMRAAEHAGDDATHAIFHQLNSSFITPFDREDIYTLAVGLDDVCDYIDAAARAVVMYNVKVSDKNAIKLAHIIDKLTDSIHSATDHLKKSKGLEQHLLEIQRLENDADEVYYRAMGELFSNAKDPIDIIKWKEVYEILENATDKCEAVGNIIESIVLKHT